MKTKFALIILFFLNSSCGYFKSLAGNEESGPEVVFAKRSEIKIVASSQNFKFIPQQIIARPGQVLKIKVVNQMKDMPIKFLLLKKDEDPIANAFLGIQKGELAEWTPPEEHILAKTKLLGFKEHESLKIKLPSIPGDYAFVSSYPGQADALKGVVKITLEKE